MYPLIEHLRRAAGNSDAPIEIVGVDARASGDVYALLRLGDCTGILTVTLSGRPVEQYQHILGTNGSLRADYIIGGVIHLSGPGDGAGALFTPYRRASQTVSGANRGFRAPHLQAQDVVPRPHHFDRRLLLRDSREQAGADEPREHPRHRRRLRTHRPGARRRRSAHEAAAEQRLAALEATLPPADASRGVVLITGGTGMLGKPVVTEMRHAGFKVRVLSRRVPKPSQRVPGVEYFPCDLGAGIDPKPWKA